MRIGTTEAALQLRLSPYRLQKALRERLLVGGVAENGRLWFDADSVAQLAREMEHERTARVSQLAPQSAA